MIYGTMKECEITDKIQGALKGTKKKTNPRKQILVHLWMKFRTHFKLCAKVHNYTVPEQSPCITTLSPQVSETNPKCTHQTNGMVYLFVDALYSLRYVPVSDVCTVVNKKEDKINSSSKRCYNSAHIEYSCGLIMPTNNSANRHKTFRTCLGDISREGAIGSVHKKGASLGARRVNRVDVNSFPMNW